MKLSRSIRIGLLAGVCVLAGVSAGIAGTSAKTSSKSKAQSSIRSGDRPGRPPGPFGGPPVHSESVVLNKAGDRFVTVTSDAGTVKSVSGDRLTITEGAKNVTYKDVTLTIPAGATVEHNDASAQLSDIKPGERVFVSQSPDGTRVHSDDAQHQPRLDGRHGHGPGRPGPGPGGPPPVG